MPGITREDRQLALRHMRSVVPRVAADRCNRVSGAGAIANTAFTRVSRQERLSPASAVR
jgi:hypothetical protein